LATRAPSKQSPVALDGGSRAWQHADPWRVPRVRTTTAQIAVAVSVVPMVGLTIWLALTSNHLQWPVASALYWSYLTAMTIAVGLYWWRRRPASRFGPLLVGFGVLIWIVSWETAKAPVLFDLGVFAEGPAFAITFYLFLAFPMGRVEPRSARWLMVVLWGVIALFFLPGVLSSAAISGSSPLARCVGGCPENVLRLASDPSFHLLALRLETYFALGVAAAGFVVYLARIRRASRPQRQTLMAVAVTSLLYLPAFFVSNFAAWILKLDPSTLNTLGWIVLGTRVLLPLGFLFALIAAEQSAALALRRLLERLVTRPTPEQWRDTIALALDDPRLALGYKDPRTGVFREATGAELMRPPEGTGRVWVPIDREGEPVAAMVIDETLAEDPELIQAAASTTLLAVENGSLEGELRASRARILEAGHAERRRIERDLHDSAQQRLVALRIHLSLVGEQLDSSDERAMLEALGDEVDETIDELRNVARGVYPPMLAQSGPVSALRAVARRSPIPVTIRASGVTRHSEALESALYFCCVECLQNAAKHAGPSAEVTMNVSQNDGHVRFSVDDDGAGFDVDTVSPGAGLTNLADRVAALGGQLTIESRPGHGTRITGDLPA
jgi:signal transduction histidine kinase